MAGEVFGEVVEGRLELTVICPLCSEAVALLPISVVPMLKSWHADFPGVLTVQIGDAPSMSHLCAAARFQQEEIDWTESFPMKPGLAKRIKAWWDQENI